MLNRFFIFVLLAGLLAPPVFAETGNGKPEPVETVFEEKGNIFLKDGDKTIQLTKSGKDREPILSPNGRWIAFSREIEGKVKECEEDKDIWECPSDQLWIMDMKTQSERLLLEPREEKFDMEKIIYLFNGKTFSPDSNTIYFITPAWAVSDAIHAVDIDGENERYVTHGYRFEVVREPLLPESKKYLAETLKDDDWRIFPEKMGTPLIKKALNDDVIGYLIIKTSGIRTISSPTPLEGGREGDDGKYYKTTGRQFWWSLKSPDGSMSIPLEASER